MKHVAVVVPARNEQERIGSCLASIKVAQARLEMSHPAIETSTWVVLDRCTDATRALVSANGAHVVECHEGNVGRARALGCESAVSAAGLPALRDLWLAGTDADTRVPSDWLVAMLESALGGAELVLGTVVPGPDLDEGRAARWRLRHPVVAGHPHVHGANLGIRADVYRRLGGFAALASGEDVDLVRRAVAIEAAIDRSPRIAVTTSGRLVGRAPDGFAGYLARLP